MKSVDDIIKEFNDAIEHLRLCRDDEEYRVLMGCGDWDYYLPHYEGIVDWLKEHKDEFTVGEIIECGSEDFGITSILLCKDSECVVYQFEDGICINTIPY
ncbi:hypothetical protein Ferp_0549 [Ferroglobus placidus DSM 10642]|uniref:Uncharacterized protein n=1 Tax=Ferroglobus placidus (strain DSM 10642 / AEDII12DO) TaxID=589924 RepID=D3S389_FERPA|nr:hypothetical protein [Ferroglobus placidus]ADC64722.1 hypothetical protein Ferp_0549 [Ferroglobus placidus DSM 10642]